MCVALISRNDSGSFISENCAFLRKSLYSRAIAGETADSFELVAGASVPLALYREHSVSREGALEAVRDSERAWHIAFTSPSLTGVRAAALAGLAVTPLPASALGRGLSILGEKDGMPPLPDLDFAISREPGPGPPPRRSRRRWRCSGRRALEGREVGRHACVHARTAAIGKGHRGSGSKFVGRGRTRDTRVIRGHRRRAQGRFGP